MLKVGDTIKCANKEDLVTAHNELVLNGVYTDFLYEKDGEQGLWLRLPCKVGDTVFVSEKALRKKKEHGAFSEKKIIFESENRPKYVKCEVVAISFKKKGNYIKVRYTGEFEEKYFDYETGYDYRIITDYIDMNFVFSSISKTVFLTKEEAEQALSEMKGV